VFSRHDDASGAKHIGVAIGDQILDLHACAAHGLFDGADVVAARAAVQESTLNAFMSLGRPLWKALRAAVTALLAADCATVRSLPDFFLFLLFSLTRSSLAQ
jgi:fumarylacetoacetase